MRFLETMWQYFQGEKLEALVFILPLGLLCLVFGSWLFSEGQPGFTKGLAIPFVAMGLFIAIVGGTVGLRTPAQTAQIEKAYMAGQSETITAERVRMEKVNKAWRWYLASWVTFAILGLALRLLTESEFLRGVGVALVFFAGVGLMVDGFAERRARAYSDEIKVLDKVN